MDLSLKDDLSHVVLALKHLLNISDFMFLSFTTLFVFLNHRMEANHAKVNIKKHLVNTNLMLFHEAYFFLRPTFKEVSRRQSPKKNQTKLPILLSQNQPVWDDHRNLLEYSRLSDLYTEFYCDGVHQEQVLFHKHMSLLYFSSKDYLLHIFIDLLPYRIPSKWIDE